MLKVLMKAIGGVDFTKYALPVMIQTSKWHNSYNTDPSAHIFLSYMHCLMVKVWCKFEQNRTKAIKVFVRAKTLNGNIAHIWFLMVAHDSFKSITR